MKRAIQIVLLAAIAACMGGCWPKVVAWSPDGKQAVIIGSDGIYMCDGAGKLSARLAEGKFMCPTWFDDGSHFAVVKMDDIKAWRDVEPALTPEERRAVDDWANRLSQQIKAGQDWTGHLNEELKGRRDHDRLGLVVLRLRERQDTATADKLTQYLPESGQSPSTVYSLHIVGVKDGAIGVGPPVAFSIYPVWDLRVNRTGTLLAFTTGDVGNDNDPQSNCDLWVAPTNKTSPPVLVDKDVAFFPDWAHDATHLLYMRASMPPKGNAARLGSLVRCEIGAPAGGAGIHTTKSEELAGMAFVQWSKVRCLRDGRVLFSSIEITLPATANDMPEQAGLYVVDPERQATVTRMITRREMESMPKELNTFEVSPDERSVAIVCGKEGRCIVLSLGSGTETATIPIPKEDADKTMLPAWRSPDELCLLAAPAAWGAKDGRPELILWSNGHDARMLSRDWPKAAMVLWK